MPVPRGPISVHNLGLAQIRVPTPKGMVTFYDPHAKQDEFHLAHAPNVLYGGAAGGGKSHAIRMDAYMRCLSVPNFRALLLRRTFPELRNTHIAKTILEAAALGGVYHKTEFTATWPNGSTLEFGHCEDENSVAKYLSTEYDAIYFDELVTFTEQQYKFISSRARTTKPGVDPVVRCASNPGGSNSYWVKRYFILKDVTKEEDPAYNPDEYAFVRATLDDNPYIDKTYEKRLMALPSEALRRAYRYGDWDVFEGQYFSEFRTLDPDGRPWHVIEEMPRFAGKSVANLPWIEVFRSIDWGYRQPGVCLWFACLPDGRLVLFDEYVFRETLAKDVAAEIKKRSQGMRVRYTTADYAMWISEGGSGESIAETFARNGVPLVQADKNRVNGWHRVHSWLRETTVAANGHAVPLLQILGPRCPYTTRTLPALVVDPTKPEDVKTKDTEDHAGDALRYAVMSRPAPSRDAAPGKKKYPRGTLGYLIQQDRREARRSRRRLY